MSFLESLEKRNSPPFDQLSIDQLPTAIKEKVLLIARYIDQALLFFTAEQSSLEDDSEDISEPLRELYEAIDDAFKPFAGTDFDLELLKFKYRIDGQDDFLADIYNKDKELFFSILEKNSSKKKQSDRVDDLSFLEAIESMGKPDYEPCNDLWNLLTMLQNLLCYWVNWPRSGLIIAGADLILNSKAIQDDFSIRMAESLSGIETKEAFLDLSLTKIAYRVGWQVNDIYEWGRRDKIRTSEAARRKKEIASINAKPVKETFFKLQFPVNASLHKVATMIFEDIEQRFGKGKSSKIGTIKRILQSDENIWKQFERKGRQDVLTKRNV